MTYGKTPTRTISTASTLRQINQALRALEQAKDPKEVLEVERALDSIEHMMKATGLFKPEQIREANEGKLWARWKLGRLLAKVERGRPGGRASTTTGRKSSFWKWAKDDLGLQAPRVVEAQRIGTLPESNVEKTLAQYRGTDDFVSYDDLILAARPYWHQEKRKQNHARIIAEAAKANVTAPDKFGPFALIYADPPWVFESYTLLSRLPDNHYPTLSDQEIIDLEIFGRTVDEIAHDDCALFLWCTSSNIKRAMRVMEAWGFEYKTQAVWDKEKIGTGIIFRNQHEVLLYGSRGDAPKPINLVSSVFRYPRGEHSAKPPEIRKAIEEMYPDFDASTRLFAREQPTGWTAFGYEAAGIVTDVSAAEAAE
jgi:N6-adenosine-specific RNA methylase IME4